MRSSDELRPTYDFELRDLEADSGARGRIFRALPAGSRVLDAGCDTGRLGDLLTRLKRCHVEGIERDSVAAEQARGRLASVWQRSLDDPEAFSGLGPFDAVLFLDVLEHLVDPWRVVERAMRVLRPAGRLYGVVPNVAHVSVVRRLALGRFDYLEHGTMDRTHLRWFTRKSFRECFEHAGLERVEIGVVPTVPYVDASKPTGAAIARGLGAVWPDGFGGSLFGVGFAPVR
jgi:SAM-dependent methyltransferase